METHELANRLTEINNTNPIGSEAWATEVSTLIRQAPKTYLHILRRWRQQQLILRDIREDIYTARKSCTIEQGVDFEGIIEKHLGRLT